MEKKNIIKYLLDALLAIGFMLMFDKMAIGISLHELLGLGIGAGIITHLVLNYKWVIEISKRIFSSKLSNRTRVLYTINLLLLVCIIIILVGGIFISKTIFTSIHSENQGLWKVLHIGVSNIALILIGVHVGLNFNWIKGMTKKLLKGIELKKHSQMVARVLVGIIFIFGIYNIYSKGFIEKTSMVFNVSSVQSIGGERGQKGMGEPQLRGGEKGNKPKGSESITDEERKNFDESFKNREGLERQGNNRGQGTSSSKVALVVNYMSILSVFAILTYYGEILIRKYK